MCSSLLTLKTKWKRHRNRRIWHKYIYIYMLIHIKTSPPHSALLVSNWVRMCMIERVGSRGFLGCSTFSKSELVWPPLLKVETSRFIKVHTVHFNFYANLIVFYSTVRPMHFSMLSVRGVQCNWLCILTNLFFVCVDWFNWINGLVLNTTLIHTFKNYFFKRSNV